jgi:hypothetical protein
MALKHMTDDAKWTCDIIYALHILQGSTKEK